MLQNQIGAGTAITIMDEYREVYSHFDLLREVAVDLHKKDLKVSDLASSLRLRNSMIEWELMDHQIESY